MDIRDLGINLINCSIESKQIDQNGGQSSWMCQCAFLRCNCNKCFFCWNGFCRGVNHLPEKNHCSSCRWYYAKGRLMHRYFCYLKGSGDAHTKKTKICKCSTFGCLKCNEPICHYCWDLGYGIHNK